MRLICPIDAFKQAHAALNGSSEKLRVHQIKQKLGGLRIYIDDLPAPFDAVLSAAMMEAEFLSFAICERCGRPGRLMVDQFGWRTTRCEDHAPPGAKASRQPPRQPFETPDGRRVLWTVDADGRLVEREITDDAKWRTLRGES
jgi:YD repeat-containing protein